MINKIKGTKDYLNLDLYNFLINKIKKHLNLYNFNEISTPILEPLELYIRSLGQETDIVSKEMFLIKSNQDKESICLRPEATASTMRAFIENNIETVPWKVYTYGPMFRYERPQKGRYRQFNQINIEVIGSKSINQDVQLIKMLERFFLDILYLENYAILINFLGCNNDRIKFKEDFKLFLENLLKDICDTCKIRKQSNILRIFDCKNQICKQIYKNAPKITDYLCKECKIEWHNLKNNLENLSVSFSHDPYLVRGLDYYQKTVFEFVSYDLGSQNAFCGGGRYDKLAKELGAKEDAPSIGAAIGVERLLILLEKIKDRLLLEQAPAISVILPLSKEQHSLALLIADEIQANNLAADILLEEDSIKSMMRKANKMGAKFAIIIGTEEQENKILTIKNMITGQENKIKQSELIKYLNI